MKINGLKSLSYFQYYASLIRGRSVFRANAVMLSHTAVFDIEFGVVPWLWMCLCARLLFFPLSPTSAFTPRFRKCKQEKREFGPFSAPSSTGLTFSLRLYILKWYRAGEECKAYVKVHPLCVHVKLFFSHFSSYYSFFSPHILLCIAGVIIDLWRSILVFCLRAERDEPGAEAKNGRDRCKYPNVFAE